MIRLFVTLLLRLRILVLLSRLLLFLLLFLLLLLLPFLLRVADIAAHLHDDLAVLDVGITGFGRFGMLLVVRDDDRLNNLLGRLLLLLLLLRRDTLLFRHALLLTLFNGLVASGTGDIRQSIGEVTSLGVLAYPLHG